MGSDGASAIFYRSIKSAYKKLFNQFHACKGIHDEQGVRAADRSNKYSEKQKLKNEWNNDQKQTIDKLNTSNKQQLLAFSKVAIASSPLIIHSFSPILSLSLSLFLSLCVYF